MSSRAELILKTVSNACIICAFSCVGIAVLSRFVVVHGATLRINDTLVLAGVILTALCVVMLIPVSAVRTWLALTQARRVRADLSLATIATSPPVIDGSYSPDSLALLVWSVDYSRSMNQNIRIMLLVPNNWAWATLTGAVFLGLSYWFIPQNYQYDAIRGAAFLLGFAFDMVARTQRISNELRKSFPPVAQVKNYALVLNPDRLVLIAGSYHFNYVWTAVGRVWEAGGIVRYKRRNRVGLIPDYAFRSKSDAKAFVATVRALKKGLPPPEYDWSAYVPAAHTSAGVWPPPTT